MIFCIGLIFISDFILVSLFWLSFNYHKFNIPFRKCCSYLFLSLQFAPPLDTHMTYLWPNICALQLTKHTETVHTLNFEDRTVQCLLYAVSQTWVIGWSFCNVFDRMFPDNKFCPLSKQANKHKTIRSKTGFAWTEII